jgi:hypothetical protein
VCCRFGVLETGSSSSSPLEVRSMTAAIGRLPLIEPCMPEEVETDLWLYDPLVVPYGWGVPIVTLSPFLVTSTRSSSSSSLATPLVCERVSFLLCNCHLPSG